MYSILKKLYPNEDFTVLETQGQRGKLIVKCNKCGKIQEFSDALKAKGRLNLCSCQKSFPSGRKKLQYLSSLFGYKILDDSNLLKVKVQCCSCGKIWEATEQTLFRGAICKCHNRNRLSLQECQEQIDKKFGEKEYTILFYELKNTKAKLRHNKCGFIWEQTPGHFLEGCGCPKCNRKRSRGETAISLYLEQKRIKFISQFSMKDKNKNQFYCDFYLPDYNLVIEYQGEQHFHPVSNFGGVNAFIKTQERDKNKRELLKEQQIELLEIPYMEYKNIENILDSKFNDYRKE